MACYNRWEQTAPGGLVRQLACGQCIGCRIEQARQWSVRCMHEASLHDPDNEFVTLTYDDDHLPADGSLNLRHVQLFLKRLRRHFRGANIRYFLSGEYGADRDRPHYHALLFGVRFPDRVYFKRSPSGERIYTSKTLTDLWKLGFASTGEVTAQSANYVARYVQKKLTGPMQYKYERIDQNGEVYKLKPEFGIMSKRPAIGKRWLDKYMTDIYPSGMMVHNGITQRPPRYYDKQHQKRRPSHHRRLQIEREIKARDKMTMDNTNSRLEQKETVKKSQLSLSKRKL